MDRFHEAGLDVHGRPSGPNRKQIADWLEATAAHRSRLTSPWNRNFKSLAGSLRHDTSCVPLNARW